MPIIVSDPREDESESVGLKSIKRSFWYFKKSHERVVWSWNTGSGNTDTTPGFLESAWASSADKRAANPEKPFP